MVKRWGPDRIEAVGRPNSCLLVLMPLFSDSKDKLEFLEGKVDDILLSRLWISANKVRLPTIWQDDEKLTSKKYPFDDLESEDEIVDSENTTEMEYDEDLNPAIWWINCFYLIHQNY